MKHAIGILGIAILVIAAAPARLGGWAVITVEGLPDHLEAGRPTRIAFIVRQHGVTPLDGLTPQVIIQQGSQDPRDRDRVAAAPVGTPGRYEAAIPAQDAGTVRITIDANWHDATITLLPLRVVPGGQASDATPAPERGRQLFIAKGCVTCHEKRDDREMIARHSVSIGPALTERQFPADWLVAKLADPAKYRAPNQWGMPNLQLSDREIAALASYVNARSSASLESAK
jgi:mono/diheme cytochrome c family protein